MVFADPYCGPTLIGCISEPVINLLITYCDFFLFFSVTFLHLWQLIWT